MLVWLIARVDRRLAETIDWLHKRGISQAVYRQYASDHAQSLRNLGIEVEWLPYSPRRYREAAMLLSGKYSGVANVIFHAVGSDATSVALMANKNCRYLDALVVSEVDPNQPSAWWHRYVHTGHFSKAIDALVVREPLRENLFHDRVPASVIPPEKIHFVRYGFDNANHCVRQKADSQVMRVGVSVQDLGNTQLRSLLRMLNWVPEGFEFKFILFGRADTLASAERISHSYFEDAFSMLKFVNCGEIGPQHWTLCDASIHTLLQPNAGAELIDAMACGAVPIVKSSQPCEPIRDGQNGFVIAPDNPVSLKQALALLVSDPGLRNEMVDSGWQLVEELYNLGETAAQLCDIYGPSLQQDSPSNEKEMSIGAGL